MELVYNKSILLLTAFLRTVSFSLSLSLSLSLPIQRITMCPHGYHHNGFMATPALYLSIALDGLVGLSNLGIKAIWGKLANH